MKSVLVWLAVMTTTFHTVAPQARCWDETGGIFLDNGTIIVRGMNNTNLTAGYIEICIERDFRAVCSDGWDYADAIQLCRKFGFLQTDLVQYCGNSCLGRSEQAGITGFWINDTDYGWSSENVTCEQNAGIVCNRVGSVQPVTPQPVTPQPVTPHQRSTGLNTIELTDTAATTGDGLKEGTEQSESCSSLAVLGGGLGGLCVILAILLTLHLAL